MQSSLTLLAVGEMYGY